MNNINEILYALENAKVFEVQDLSMEVGRISPELTTLKLTVLVDTDTMQDISSIMKSN